MQTHRISPRMIRPVVSLLLIGVIIAVVFMTTPAHAFQSGSGEVAQAIDPPPPASAPDIVGGQEAQPGAWPWQVWLSYQGSFFCGGTLIHPSWVLTAKHCTDGSVADYRVILGDHDRNTNENTEQTIAVQDIIPHPNADLALLRLASSAQINDRVRIIDWVTAPVDSSLFEAGDVAMITGWGLTSEGGDASPVLRQAGVPIVSNATCNAEDSYGGRINDGELCAGFAAGGVDSCQGDSGGPMVVSAGQGAWRLAGVTSWGDGCARPNLYGVYVRVASYAMWISAHVRPDTRYQLRARHSNKCLDVQGGTGATGDGVNVYQWECVGANQTNQLWTITPLDTSDDNNAIFRVRPVHSNKCLDVVSGSNQDGANVIQYTCGSASSHNQLWRFNPTGDANQVRVLHSNKCLDVAGGTGATNNGDNVHQWGCIGASQTNQLWHALPLGADTIPPNGDFTEPAPNAQVSAPIWLRVQAQDNTGGSGMARVKFTTNGTGQWRVIAEDNQAPYELLWDMSGIPTGQPFMIGAELYDNAGNRVDRARWITRQTATDTTPPTGDFTEPAVNAQVNSPVWLRVQAQDNAGGSGVAKIRFTSNGTGQWRLISEDSSPPYEVQWDMAGVPVNQPFMIGAEIHDRSGNRTDRVRWITKRSAADTTPPSGDFTEPAANSQVTAPVWLRVQAQDNAGGSGVARVVFTTNGTGQWQVIASDLTAPYELLWDMAGVPPGQSFMIGAEMYDNAGNRADRARWITRITTASSLRNGDFEQGRYAGWDEYSTHGWPIVVSADQLPFTRQPHSGSWAAWLAGEHDELSVFWQRGVSIQPGNAFLQFWYMIGSEDYCGYDFAGVVINGSTVARVFDLCAETNTGGWVRTTVNLSAYAGQNVTIAFRSETDSSLYSSFWVDDVSFVSAAAGPDEQPATEDTNVDAPSEPGADLVKPDRLPVQPQVEPEPWPKLWESLPTK